MKTAKQAAMLLVIFSCFFFAPSASADPSAWPEWTCATFPGTVEEATAYFDEFGGPATLEADADGDACNEGEDTEGPSAWPEWTCATFPDGWDATIVYFDTYGGPATLDSDGDGVACNETEAQQGPTAWPE